MPDPQPRHSFPDTPETITVPKTISPTTTDGEFAALLAEHDAAIEREKQARREIEQQRHKAAEIARRADAVALRERIKPTIGADADELAQDVAAAHAALIAVLNRVAARTSRLTGQIEAMQGLGITDHGACLALTPSPENAGISYQHGAVIVDDVHLEPVDGGQLVQSIVRSAMGVVAGDDPDPFERVDQLDRTVSLPAGIRYFLSSSHKVLALGPSQAEDPNYRRSTVAEITREEADRIWWGLARPEVVDSQVIVVEAV